MILTHPAFYIPMILVAILVLISVVTSGIFDSEEAKEEKRLKQIERDLAYEERETTRVEALAKIKDQTLSCKYIADLIERDSRLPSYLDLVDSGKIKEGVRGYWNANNCGFEWNWYD